MAVNVPQTVWRDPSGLVEFDSNGTDYIVDTLGNNLVDTAVNDIVDTGVMATLIPSTVWTEVDNV